LIDCGVHAADLHSIGAAIDQMNAETGGHLALLIMTHRHADHISGFATAKAVFATFTVERVWMSWFEDPNDPTAANFQSTLTTLAANLQSTLLLRGIDQNSDQAEFFAMAENITGAASAAGGQGSNAVALQTLHGGFANKPPIDYYQSGDTPTLPDSLVTAGLTAQILGPPIDPNLVAQMNGKGEQYLAGSSDAGLPPQRFSDVFDCEAANYPPAAFELFSASQIQENVAAQTPDLMLSKTVQADNTLNNQSLVVLFTFGGKTMLFAGDAQWGNWQNFLFDGKPGTAGSQLGTDATKILGNIDFYKVGHHGSTNATPIDALKAMKNGVVAMCSTAEGAYGKVQNNSEVPRIPLLAALNTKTQGDIARSDQVAVAGTLERKPDPVAPIPPLPTPPFTTGPDDSMYVDYEM
jgi:hypothetical protein